MQLKPSITMALHANKNHGQEPVSTHNANKHVVEILDAKYEKTDILVIAKNYCSCLSATVREKLLSKLL